MFWKLHSARRFPQGFNITNRVMAYESNIQTIPLQQLSQPWNYLRQPIWFNGRPRLVYCKKKSTLVYTPQWTAVHGIVWSMEWTMIYMHRTWMCDDKIDTTTSQKPTAMCQKFPKTKSRSKWGLSMKLFIYTIMSYKPMELLKQTFVYFSKYC